MLSLPSLFTLANLLSFLSHYGYALLIPLAIVEGPFVTMVAAFLASMGVMDAVIVYFIAVFADFFGDSLWYWAARLGRNKFLSFALKHGEGLGITDENLARAEGKLKRHLLETVIIGKVTDVLMIVIVIASGVLRVGYKKLIGITVSIDIFKDLAFVLIGFYFGRYISAISNNLDRFYAVSTLAIVIVLVVYLNTKYVHRYLSSRK